MGDTQIIHELKEFESKINSAYYKEHSDYNIYQFIPVTVCSAFESFFRFNIEELIDTKRIEWQRILKIDEMKTFKCDILMLQGIFKKKSL